MIIRCKYKNNFNTGPFYPLYFFRKIKWIPIVMIYISFQYDGKLIFQSPNNKRLKLTEVESSENQKK
jgi:hypothetical protein